MHFCDCISKESSIFPANFEYADVLLIYKAKIVHVTVNCQCPVFMSCFVITFAGKLENLFGLEQADPTPDKAQAEPTPDKADRKSTRLNSSHLVISYAVFCLKKKSTISKRKSY